MDKQILRKKKLELRVHIRYLIGYDFTNIYRIWIPSQRKVIRTRDVTLNNNLLYSALDLDIGAVLKEHVDMVIESIELPERQVTAIADDNDLETAVEEVPAIQGPIKVEKTPGLVQRQLPTPSQSPGLTPAPESLLPAAAGNQARRGNEISGDFNPQNIIQDSCT